MIAFTGMADFGPPRLGGAEARDVYSTGVVVCPLCLAHHDEIVTLECGHEFCKRCLSQRRDGNMIKCPTCSRLMDLKDQGIEGLHTNYLINNILNMVSLPDDFHSDMTMKTAVSPRRSPKVSATSTTCFMCRGTDVTVSNFCVSCQVYVCGPCAPAHQAAPLAIGQHQIIPISQPESHQQHQKPVFCSKHLTEKLEYCCNNCTQPVCRECIVVEHIGHNIVRISETAQLFKRHIPSIMSDLKGQGARISNVLTQVERCVESMEGRAKRVNAEVKSYVRSNIKALEEAEHDLLTQIESVRSLKSELLCAQQADLKGVKSRLVDAISLISGAWKAQGDVDLIYIKQSLHSAINKIQADMNHLSTCHEDDQIEFILREPHTAMRSSIAQIGSITSGLSSLHTTASGHGLHCAIVNKYAKFKVICRNHCNKQVNQSLDMVEVNIFAPDGSRLKVDVICKPDGVIHYSYFPSTLGTYTISIEIRGRHIRNSPIKVKVRKRRNYYNIAESDHQLGSDGERDGQLCRPWGVCCDPLGHIIVADRSNNRVQVFNPDGSYRLKFGETGSGLGQFNKPAGVAVNSTNQIVVADKDNHRIQVFSFDGRFVHSFGERGSLNGQLHYPWDVACNEEDCILVSDTRNHRIQLFSSAGQYLSKFNFHSPAHQRMQLPQPRGVCFTQSGDILVTDFNKHRLMFLRYNLQSVQMFGNEGQGNGQFFRPQGVAVDLEGNILVSEGRNNRVQIFRPDGTFLAKFGSVGTGNSEFDKPSGICVTPDGYIVVVDFGNNRIMFF
ncbi:E3 ubiquitin-protein ligase TRIM71-like [Watersipora subatra]|uniref:E3 ubiquitin-protein ligase TRIM71-like n=1 Tax=Watersipora subatra TaxID=2589382 RepID=UPI00355C0922